MLHFFTGHGLRISSALMASFSRLIGPSVLMKLGMVEWLVLLSGAWFEWLVLLSGACTCVVTAAFQLKAKGLTLINVPG